ncbi:MAG: hypothetical protein WDA25_01105 [Paracoccaceae bacterium]
MNATTPQPHTPDDIHASLLTLSREIDQCILPTLEGSCPADAITTATQALFMSLIPIAMHALAIVLQRGGDPENLLNAMEQDCKLMVHAALQSVLTAVENAGKVTIQ